MGFSVPSDQAQLRLVDILLGGGFISYAAVVMVSAMYVRKLREALVTLLLIVGAGIVIELFLMWMVRDASWLTQAASGRVAGAVFSLLCLLQLGAPIAAWIVIGSLSAFTEDCNSRDISTVSRRKKIKHTFEEYLLLLGFYLFPTSWLLIPLPGEGRSEIPFFVAGLWFAVVQVGYALWLDRRCFWMLANASD